MSNKTLPAAIVSAAQDADAAAQALPPRDEKAVAKALRDMAIAVRAMAKKAQVAVGAFRECLNAGATVDEASFEFRAAYMSADIEGDFETAMAEARKLALSSGATAKTGANKYGQRNAEQEASYNRANNASKSARDALGVQSERGKKAGANGQKAGRKPRAAEPREPSQNETAGLVVPFCATPEEFRAAALAYAEFGRRLVNQNKKLEEDRLTSAAQTLINDMVGDLITVYQK